MSGAAPAIRTVKFEFTNAFTSSVVLFVRAVSSVQWSRAPNALVPILNFNILLPTLDPNRAQFINSGEAGYTTLAFPNMPSGSTIAIYAVQPPLPPPPPPGVTVPAGPFTVNAGAAWVIPHTPTLAAGRGTGPDKGDSLFEFTINDTRTMFFDTSFVDGVSFGTITSITPRLLPDAAYNVSHARDQQPIPKPTPLLFAVLPQSLPTSLLPYKVTRAPSEGGNVVVYSDKHTASETTLTDSSIGEPAFPSSTLPIGLTDQILAKAPSDFNGGYFGDAARGHNLARRFFTRQTPFPNYSSWIHFETKFSAYTWAFDEWYMYDPHSGWTATVPSASDYNDATIGWPAGVTPLNASPRPSIADVTATGTLFTTDKREMANVYGSGPSQVVRPGNPGFDDPDYNHSAVTAKNTLFWPKQGGVCRSIGTSQILWCGNASPLVVVARDRWPFRTAYVLNVEDWSWFKLPDLVQYELIGPTDAALADDKHISIAALPNGTMITATEGATQPCYEIVQYTTALTPATENEFKMRPTRISRTPLTAPNASVITHLALSRLVLTWMADSATGMRCVWHTCSTITDPTTSGSVTVTSPAPGGIPYPERLAFASASHIVIPGPNPEFLVFLAGTSLTPGRAAMLKPVTLRDTTGSGTWITVELTTPPLPTLQPNDTVTAVAAESVWDASNSIRRDLLVFAIDRKIGFRTAVYVWRTGWDSWSLMTIGGINGFNDHTTVNAIHIPFAHHLGNIGLPSNEIRKWFLLGLSDSPYLGVCYETTPNTGAPTTSTPGFRIDTQNLHVWMNPSPPPPGQVRCLDISAASADNARLIVGVSEDPYVKTYTIPSRFNWNDADPPVVPKASLFYEEKKGIPAPPPCNGTADYTMLKHVSQTISDPAIVAVSFQELDFNTVTPPDPVVPPPPGPPAPHGDPSGPPIATLVATVTSQPNVPIVRPTTPTTKTVVTDLYAAAGFIFGGSTTVGEVPTIQTVSHVLGGGTTPSTLIQVGVTTPLVPSQGTATIFITANGQVSITVSNVTPIFTATLVVRFSYSTATPITVHRSFSIVEDDYPSGIPTISPIIGSPGRMYTVGASLGLLQHTDPSVTTVVSFTRLANGVVGSPTLPGTPVSLPLIGTFQFRRDGSYMLEADPDYNIHINEHATQTVSYSVTLSITGIGTVSVPVQFESISSNPLIYTPNRIQINAPPMGGSSSGGVPISVGTPLTVEREDGVFRVLPGETGLRNATTGGVILSPVGTELEIFAAACQVFASPPSDLLPGVRLNLPWTSLGVLQAVNERVSVPIGSAAEAVQGTVAVARDGSYTVTIDTIHPAFLPSTAATAVPGQPLAWVRVFAVIGGSPIANTPYRAVTPDYGVAHVIDLVVVHADPLPPPIAPPRNRMIRPVQIAVLVIVMVVFGILFSVIGFFGKVR